jgi:hypothetical protein
LNPKIIGIISASYSGTTTMTMLLGGLNRWFPAGETHWMKDFSFDDFYCNVCGASCQKWTDELRRELFCCDDWWKTISASFPDYDFLVSSDKDPEFFRKNRGADFFILQWKDPRGWYYSARKHEGIALERAIDLWCGFYEHCLQFLEGKQNCVVVNWDEFSRDPFIHLNRILAALGVPPVTSMPPRNSAHMIGGNLQARGIGQDESYTQYFDAGIREDRRWQESNSQDENDKIMQSARVQSLVSKLKLKQI